MELRICHLYPELLNLNGDFGNVAILTDRAKRRGIDVKVTTLTFGQRFVADEYDFVFLGNGQPDELMAVLEELSAYDSVELKKYTDAEGVLLAVCGGYELLGEEIRFLDGTVRRGLGLLPICFEKQEKRFIGNAVVQSGGNSYIGFENHDSCAKIGSLTPLGKVLLGFGNGETGEEGCRCKGVLGTYLHGPLLAKSPELADELLTAALSKRYGPVTLSTLDNTFETKAREQLLKRFFPTE